MIKLRNLFILFVAVLAIHSCGDDNFGNNPFADVNYEDLAIQDNDSIVKFLKNHYYDTTVDSIKPLVTGQTAIYDDSKLVTMDVRENDIDYKLYVYVATQGDYGNDPDKGFPSKVDSVFAKYTGRTFSGTAMSETNFDNNQSGIWFSLTNVVRGWAYGFTKFKGGELKRDPNGGPFNGPITYLNGGKGVLFIPSGLAYPSSNIQNWNNFLVDTNILFYIDLLTLVPNTDHDNDNVSSIDEDIDGDGNVNNDDTDEDSIPNFFDTDDDNDGVLTKDEDRNGDGDPTNDFNDPDNPTLPDYLNPNIK
ncbi:MAG: peptidylprolyl isomerase [Flavobacteriaceae bacterium]|nr:peptidylprolyl isomerase [Flavobacteriaceae bacterium]